MTSPDPDPRHPHDWFGEDPTCGGWEHQRAERIGRHYANDTPHPLLTIAAFLGALAIGAIVWLLLGILIANLAAPRSAETTAPDPTRDLSAPQGPSARLSGAPHAVAPPGVVPRHDPAGGAPSPSPAVALEAASEGLPGPTTPMPATTLTGYAGWAVPSLGSRYLAIREPRGTLVTICGPAACWTTVSTDYGPSSRIRPSRVADIAVGRWEVICGVPRRFGLCEVTIVVERRPGGAIPTAPATDR